MLKLESVSLTTLLFSSQLEYWKTSIISNIKIRQIHYLSINFARTVEIYKFCIKKLQQYKMVPLLVDRSKPTDVVRTEAYQNLYGGLVGQEMEIWWHLGWNTFLRLNFEILILYYFWDTPVVFSYHSCWYSMALLG